MTELSREDLLQALFDSIPAKIVVKDLDGKDIYQNQAETHKSDDCGGSLITFPLKDKKGVTIGSCEWVGDSRMIVPQDKKERYETSSSEHEELKSQQLEESLRAAKEKAQEADCLKSSFLANISHEIRTPLNGIIGHIDLALSNGLSEDSRQENLEGLNTVKACGMRLLAFIEGVLDLSKLQAGQMLLKGNETCSIKDTIAQATSQAETMIQCTNQNIDFTCSVDSSIQDTIEADAVRLGQVIEHLVTNAIKFTEGKGKVHMSVAQLNQETIQFMVQDQGKGIPTSHLESIFEPFRQMELSDSRAQGGAGIGLSLCRGLVQLMGGKMRVDSSSVGPDRGSLFAFSLPYRPLSNENAIAAPSAPTVTPKRHITSTRGKNQPCPRVVCQSKAAGTGGCSHKFKILVAEDDPVSRKMVTRMLQRTGYDVSLACNGQEAVSAYETAGQDVSLVLMDCQMPVLDGHEATRRIRESEGDRPPVPIIALSAGTMKSEQEKGLSAGMTEYLTKPVDWKRLAQTLEKYLQPAPANPAA